jgi:hypothetical protein
MGTMGTMGTMGIMGTMGTRACHVPMFQQKQVDQLTAAANGPCVTALLGVLLTLGTGKVAWDAPD